MYLYANANPVNENDPAGLWPTSTHNDLLNRTFGLRRLPPGDLEILRNASRDQDDLLQGGQFVANSYQHSMAEPHENPAVARRRRDEFVNYQVALATILDREGDRCRALMELGRALHAVMDQTSPEHVDANGDPLVWLGMSHFISAGIHVVSEGHTPPPGVFTELNTRMWNLYVQAFGPDINH